MPDCYLITHACLYKLKYFNIAHQTLQADSLF